MSTITVNGKRVTKAAVTMPLYGAWSAEVSMATDEEIASPCTMVIGDMTIIGTVDRQASFSGTRTAQLVGGAGGWRKTLPAKGYGQVVGVKLSTVLADVANECGESISVDSDRMLGTSYARESAKGEETLTLLLGGRWWVDNAGVTQTRARDAATVVTPFMVISWTCSDGRFEIATESIKPWQPGATFSTNTVPTPQVISSVTIDSANDGKLRLRVLSQDANASDRLRASMRSLIRSELASLSYAGVWEYKVAPSIGLGLVSTIDCSPVDSRMPALSGVPLVGMGVVAPPVVGTSCRIQFVNCDPSRPECVSLGGTTEHVMTLEATLLLLYNFFYAMSLVAPAPAGMGLLIQPLITPALIAAAAASSIPAPPGLIAQIAAAAAISSAMTSGTAPSNTIGPLAAAVPALSTKLLDVSGLFPGLGVPNGS